MTEIAEQVLVSCEHASNRLVDGLHLDARLLDLHIAWDPGALQIARRIADHFGAPLWAGEHSRLVVDLNRSIGNRMLIRKVSDGHRIPFNYGLSTGERAHRIARYYRPYRDGVAAAIDEIIRRRGRCVHICVHTFTPALAGTVRGNDVGLLHDPGWEVERAACDDVRRWLDAETRLVTWFNRPYSGTADGILPAMRRRFAPEQFVGIELEINQKYADRADALARIGEALARALAASPTLRRGAAAGC